MKQFGLWIGAALASAILVAFLWLIVVPFFFELMKGTDDATNFPEKYHTGMILSPAPTQAEFTARRLVVATGSVDTATVTGRAIKRAVRDALFTNAPEEQE